MASRPDLLPKDFDTALAKLIEECGEVLQEAGKLLRFGIIAVDKKTGQQYDNGEALLAEMEDVEETIALVKKFMRIKYKKQKPKING